MLFNFLLFLIHNSLLQQYKAPFQVLFSNFFHFRSTIILLEDELVSCTIVQSKKTSLSDSTRLVAQGSIFSDSIVREENGAVFSLRGGALIVQCIFRDSATTEKGGAIYAFCDVTIELCNFSNCRITWIDDTSANKGGSLYFEKEKSIQTVSFTNFSIPMEYTNTVVCRNTATLFEKDLFEKHSSTSSTPKSLACAVVDGGSTSFSYCFHTNEPMFLQSLSASNISLSNCYISTLSSVVINATFARLQMFNCQVLYRIGLTTPSFLIQADGVMMDGVYFQTVSMFSFLVSANRRENTWPKPDVVYLDQKVNVFETEASLFDLAVLPGNLFTTLTLATQSQFTDVCATTSPLDNSTSSVNPSNTLSGQTSGQSTTTTSQTSSGGESQLATTTTGSIQWYYIILIILGVLIFICGLLGLVWYCVKKGKEDKKYVDPCAPHYLFQ